MESPITAEKVRKGTCLNACLVDTSSWLCLCSCWLTSQYGGKFRSWSFRWGSGSRSNVYPWPLFLNYFLIYLSFLLFPPDRPLSELRSILARVVNRGEMSALYWMWLCVGYSQLHTVISMKQESPTTAEKVQRPFCVLLADKVTL